MSRGTVLLQRALEWARFHIEITPWTWIGGIWLEGTHVSGQTQNHSHPSKHICSRAIKHNSLDFIRRVHTGFGSEPAAISEWAAALESPDISSAASWTFRLFPFSRRSKRASEERSSQVEKWLSDDGGPAAEQAGRVLGHGAGLRGTQGDLGRPESGSCGSGVQRSRACPGYCGWSQYYSAARWGCDSVDNYLGLSQCP